MTFQLDPDSRDEQEESVLSQDEVLELEEAEPDAQPVSYSGTDFDAEGLVRRLTRGDIVIPSFGHGEQGLELAAFQRSFVWRKSQMDRFIESLLLGYPIPGIMLVQQVDKRYLVLDGQQRLRTLQAFYSGIHLNKVFQLENVADEFRNLTYASLLPEQRRTLDNTFIQATIVRTDGTRESLESIYKVFERLNSGGTQLTPHEIRVALYPGAFVEFLGQLNSEAGWRQVYGPISPRLRDQEVILRILALYMRSDEYYRPLKKFLNDFLGDHRDLTKLPVEEIRGVFVQATEALAAVDARQTLRRAGQRVNAALLEAVVIAAMRRAGAGGDMGAAAIGAALSALARDDEITRATTVSTANEENLKSRLEVAANAFSIS
jgi:hypothetical protein